MVWIYNGTRKPNETKIHFWNYWLPEKAVPEFLYKYVHYLFFLLLLGSCLAVSRLGHLTPMTLIRDAYSRMTIPGAMKFGVLFPLVNAFASLWSFQILTAPNLARMLPSQFSHLTSTIGGIIPSTIGLALLSPLVVSAIVLTFGSYASRLFFAYFVSFCSRTRNWLGCYQGFDVFVIGRNCVCFQYASVYGNIISHHSTSLSSSCKFISTCHYDRYSCFYFISLVFVMYSSEYPFTYLASSDGNDSWTIDRCTTL